MDKIKDFCRKWKIKEFSLFGSVLREAFRPDSDVDVLVSFEEKVSWSLYDVVEMKDELKAIFGRPQPFPPPFNHDEQRGPLCSLKSAMQRT
jgi:predicted nucleotidyltransferase